MPSEKTLKRIVIILGVLLVVGFAVVVTTIIYRAANLASGNTETAQESTAATSLNIPDGAKIISGSRNGDLLTLHYETAQGDQKVLVLNMQTNEIVSELDITNENQ